MHFFPSYLLEERGILFVFDGKETEKYFRDQTAEDEICLSLVKSDKLFLQDALICQLLYVLQYSYLLSFKFSVVSGMVVFILAFQYSFALCICSYSALATVFCASPGNLRIL